MKELIEIKSPPVSTVLNNLLADKTTKKNIIFATDAYSQENSKIAENTPITQDILFGMDAYDIQPRVLKSQEEQSSRTKKKAEVFTPSWVCNKMNNYCDEEWFERANVFNIENEGSWTSTTDKIEFPKGKSWKDYINSTRLEITCGEAPYIVSRYDASTGELITIKNRIGILDRKLRVINENVNDSKVLWFKSVYSAFKSVYGYEYQGDSLLIARINLLMTFYDYVKDKWGEPPTKKQLLQIADIITWNFWQMDGLKGIVPNGGADTSLAINNQISFFDLLGDDSKEESLIEVIECEIFDWEGKRPIKYNDLKRGNK